MKQLKIKNISKIEHNSKRYDISVADNNNLFANNILIHNCQNLPKVLELFKNEIVYVTEKIDCLDENGKKLLSFKVINPDFLLKYD